MNLVELRPVGDAAVLAVLGDRIGIDESERVWHVAATLREALTTGIDDIVPAYASVLVRFNPRRIDLVRVMSAMRGTIEQMPEGGRYSAQRKLVIGVCFGGEHGVDFEAVAHELGMREARLREAFCKPDYRVAFNGFIAGFPYFLGLHPALRVRRLETPRPRVPGGSVAIAGGQCGIYPRQSPGGWRLLGRTRAPVFDPDRPEPTLFRPGDIVCFRACSDFEETAAVGAGRG